MTIYEKLLTIQQELKAPKNQYNSFGNYNYRSSEDIQEAVKPLLKKTGTVLLVNDTVELIGARYYIKATAVLQDTESSECIANTAYARETEDRPKMDASQLTGSCSSYARKYALNGLFCIDDSKDADSLNHGQQDGRKNTHLTQTENIKGSRQQEQKVDSRHIAVIREELGRTGVSLKSMLSSYKLATLEQMTITQFKDAMDKLKQYPTAGNEQMSLSDYMGRY